MAAKLPIARQVQWLTMIPHGVIVAAFVYLFYRLNIGNPYIAGASLYLFISISLRLLVPSNHRKGIKLVRSKDYPSAITEFQKSYDFFSKHLWIDKHRYVTLLSSSRMAYREMALINMGFCYAQTKQGDKARDCYKRTLQEFPGNQIAEAALNMLNA